MAHQIYIKIEWEIIFKFCFLSFWIKLSKKVFIYSPGYSNYKTCFILFRRKLTEVWGLKYASLKIYFFLIISFSISKIKFLLWTKSHSFLRFYRWAKFQVFRLNSKAAVKMFIICKKFNYNRGVSLKCSIFEFFFLMKKIVS